MRSITLREVFRKAACQVGSGEDLVCGDLNSTMAGMTKVLLEVMAESEVERRVGVRLHERGESRSDYRNGYRRRMVQLSYQVVEIRIPRLRCWCARWRQKYPGVVAKTQVACWRSLLALSCIGSMCGPAIPLKESFLSCADSSSAAERSPTGMRATEPYIASSPG